MMTPTESKWQRVFRSGIAPQLSQGALLELYRGLSSDDPRIIQGSLCSPPPLDALMGCEAKAGCAISYTGMATGCKTVGEVAEYFHRVCDAADAALNEPSACRHFLNWFDELPRNVMRTALLLEIESLLSVQRQAA